MASTVRITAGTDSRRKADSPGLAPLRSTRLLDQVRERIQTLHYSRRTEQAYVFWCKAFIRFHGLKHPSTMGGPEVEAFLTHLVVDRGMAVASHRQALAALLFLYGRVLGQELPWMNQIGRPTVSQRLPVVLSVDEIRRIFCELSGVHGLFAQLLYGTGVRIHEGLQLRVKDIDFSNRAIFVRNGKGGKDRIVMLPESLRDPLREQLAVGRVVWADDIRSGHAGVEMPSALDRKYPRAGSSWTWFWSFRKGSYRPTQPVG